MLDAASAEVLTRSLMLGTARQPLPVDRIFNGAIKGDDPKAMLKALALLGQHGRFRRPAPMTAIPAQSLFADPRRPLPESARPVLIALLSKRKGVIAGDMVAAAVADAMARNNVKLHPFDLPRLEDFAKGYGEQLGLSALAWLERHESKASNSPHDDVFIETVDESNWQQARPGQKSAFIANIRSSDPARARELVESVFPREQAPSRLALLKALANKLSLDDAPFLEGLANDRAQSVRDMANQMLEQVPGTDRANERIRECLGRIKVTKTGFLRRRVEIHVDYPDSEKTDIQRGLWAVSAFGTIDLEDFAKALGLSIAAIADAASHDEILRSVLVVQAERSGHFDLLARLVRSRVEGDRINTSGSSGRHAAQSLAEATIQPDLWKDLPDRTSLWRIYQHFRAPLPERTARDLLITKAWRSFLDFTREREQPEAEEVLPLVAILIPHPLRAALRSDVVSIAPNLTARAFAVMSLLDHIEAA